MRHIESSQLLGFAEENNPYILSDEIRRLEKLKEKAWEKIFKNSKP
jgi:hypothetical protein